MRHIPGRIALCFARMVAAGIPQSQRAITRSVICAALVGGCVLSASAEVPQEDDPATLVRREQEVLDALRGIDARNRRGVDAKDSAGSTIEAPTWRITTTNLSPQDGAKVTDRIKTSVECQAERIAGTGAGKAVVSGRLQCRNLQTGQLHSTSVLMFFKREPRDGVTDQRSRTGTEWPLAVGDYELAGIYFVQERPNGPIFPGDLRFQKFEVKPTLGEAACLAELAFLAKQQELSPPQLANRIAEALRKVELSKSIWDAVAEIPRIDELDLSGLSVKEFPREFGRCSVSSLRLAHCNVTAETLEILKTSNRLEKLHLTGAALAPGDLRPLQDMTRLQELSITRATLNNQDLEVISSLSRLTSLSLIECSFPEGIPEGSLETLSRVINLDLTGSAIRDRDLPQIARCRQLETISLRNTLVRKSNFEMFRDLPRLRSIDVSGNALSLKAVKQLVSLAALRKLVLETPALPLTVLAAAEQRGVSIQLTSSHADGFADLWALFEN